MMQVPTLLRLTTERVAELINKKLPISGSIITGNLTNQVIEELRRYRLLNFEVMKRILTSNQFVIDSIYLEDIDSNLEMCFKHNLLTFRIGEMDTTIYCRKIIVNKVLEAALNEKSLKQLKTLDLSGDKLLNLMWPMFVAQNLRALECLSFANRTTTKRTWALFNGKFPQLRCLNISNTGITDIRCISGLRNLEVLIMHDLNITKGNIDVLTHLKKLKVLDISRSIGDGVDETTDTHLELVHGIYRKSVDAIKNGTTTPWPELQALDISGLHFSRQGMDQALAFVHKIVRAHPNLAEIGLLGTQLNFVDVQVSGRHLQVYNEVSRKSLLTSLSHYKNLNHPAFVRIILRSIETKLQMEYADFSPGDLKECLRNVCLSMHHYPEYVDIEDTGVSCLRELCNRERAQHLSVTEVRSIIHVCLDALDYQNRSSDLDSIDDIVGLIRFNVFAIFFNFWDQKVVVTDEIDLCRIVTTGFDTMMLNADAETDMYIMYTILMVTFELKKTKKEELSQDGKYVKQLVNKMVVLEAKFREATNEDNKANATNVVNCTLATLLELKNNLAFLEVDGVSIAIRVLTTFQNINVQVNILQIFNDLVEDGLALQQLCKSENVSIFLSCLDGNFEETDPEKLGKIVEKCHIAGLALTIRVANGHWECDTQKKTVCQKLLDTIDQWADIGDHVVCMYENDAAFDNLYNLICVSKFNGAVMWVLWTVLHLLMTDNVKTPDNRFGYLDMFLQSNLCTMTKRLADGVSEHIQDLDNRVVLLAKKVLEFVDAHNIEE